MKPKKPSHVLNRTAIDELSTGETAYFQDCDDLSLVSCKNYRDLSEGHIQALMQSIQETGVQAEVALVATPDTDGRLVITVEDGHHRLEAVRRLRAEAERSGRSWLYRPLPCRVRILGEDSAAGTVAIASVMRNQLRKEEHLWDKLAAFERLRETGETTSGISRLVGLDERSVRRILSLRRIPEPVKRFAKERVEIIKAATLYKLAAVIEKDSASGDSRDLETLLAEASGGSLERQAAAMDLAATFLQITPTAGPDLQGGFDSTHPLMIAFLALDTLPRVKAEPQAPTPPPKPAAANPDRKKSPAAPKKGHDTLRSGGAPKPRAKTIPEGWVAIDPSDLKDRLADAGMPEEWRQLIASLLPSETSESKETLP